MAIKLADTLAPMADFPAAMAEHIAFSDGETLQKKLDDGSLGGGGVEAYIELSQEEYDALGDEEKVNGQEYRTYDTGHIYKLGVEFGKETDISGKQDNLNKVKFTVRRNGVSDPRYCLIGSSDLNQTLLMNEPYRFQGVFGSNNNVEKSIIDLSVSFKNGAVADKIFRGYANTDKGFQYVDLMITVDETTNRAYAYVDFMQESTLATGEITVPSINTEYYMDFETEFVLTDTYIGTELCRMSDYAKIITNIDDTTTSTDTTWSSQKTSNELAKKLTKNYASLKDANAVIDSGNGLHIYRVMNSCLNIPVNRIGLIISNNYYDNAQYIRITQTYMTNDDDAANGLIYMRYGVSNNNGSTYTWSDWIQIGCLNDTKSSATSTYSSAKIDEKYGAYTFGTANATQWLKLTLGNSSKFQPIVISDQYGGKVEITGMADDGTYKPVKLVRYSYGDWTTYNATDYTTTTDGDANYKIRRLYYYPTNGCYYLEIRQWCTVKVSGATTKPEMVTSLPVETSKMTQIPESQFASKSELAAKQDDLSARKVYVRRNSSANKYVLLATIDMRVLTNLGQPLRIKGVIGNMANDITNIDLTINARNGFVKKILYGTVTHKNFLTNDVNIIITKSDDGKTAYVYLYCISSYAYIDAEIYLGSVHYSVPSTFDLVGAMQGTEYTSLLDSNYVVIENVINDTSTGDTTSTWSSSKIASTIDNKFLVGTAEPTTATLPVGAWYGRYE